MNKLGSRETFEAGVDPVKVSKDRVKKRLIMKGRDEVVSDNYLGTIAHPKKKQVIISG